MLPKEYQDMVMQTSVGTEGKMEYEVLRHHVIGLATQKMQMLKPVRWKGKMGNRRRDMKRKIGTWLR